MQKKWTVRQDRGSWWATIIKGDGAPVGSRVPVILIHPKGDERGSGVDWKAGTYRAAPNEHGAWWLRGGFDRAVVGSELVLLRRSMGHDENGVAIAGGDKIGVFRISSVAADDEHFTFKLVERVAEAE